MKAIAFLSLVLTGVVCALAQTFAVSSMSPIEAAKLASRLTFGAREENADQFMATNGLKLSYRLAPSQGKESDHYYLLTEDDQRIVLHFSISSAGGDTNRVLTSAWLSRSADRESKTRIKLINAPTNAP
jgi:hypothetical protein